MFLPPPGASAEAASPSVELRPVHCSSAVQRALSHNPLLHAADANVRGSQSALSAEWGRYLPVLKVRSLVTAIPSIHGDALNGYVDDSEWGAFFQVEADASMPLYAFGQMARLRDLAEAGVDVSRAAAAVQRAEVTFQTRRAWLGWIFGLKVQEVLVEGRGYLEKARARIEEQDEEDDLDFDQVDLLKLRVHEAEMVDRELQVEAGILRASEGLKQAMALGVHVVLEAESMELLPIMATLPAFEAQFERALQVRPEMKAARSALIAAQKDIGAERGRLLPSLGVDGFYRFATTDVADDQLSPFAYDPYNRHEGGVGLSLKWKLDLGQQLPAIGKAEARLVRREAELAQARAVLVADLRDVRREVDMWGRLMKVEKRAVRAARSWLVARSDMHSSGFGSLDEVADALVEFHTRRIAELNAIHEHNLAWMRLERVVGGEVQGVGFCRSGE